MEDLDDMLIGRILAYHLPPSILLYYRVLYHYVSSVLVTQHSIPFENLNIKWNISYRKRGIIFIKVCRMCSVIICKRVFYDNLLIINTYRIDVCRLS